jgi:hypothetical protein
LSTERCPLCGESLCCPEHGARHMVFVDEEPQFAFCAECAETDPGWPAVKHLHFDWGDGDATQNP